MAPAHESARKQRNQVLLIPRGRTRSGTSGRGSHIHTKSVKHRTGPSFITYVGEPGIMGASDVAKDLQVALAGLDASQIAVAPGLYLPKGVTLKFGARFTVLTYEAESPV